MGVERFGGWRAVCATCCEKTFSPRRGHFWANGSEWKDIEDVEVGASEPGWFHPPTFCGSWPESKCLAHQASSEACWHGHFQRVSFWMSKCMQDGTFGGHCKVDHTFSDLHWLMGQLNGASKRHERAPRFLEKSQKSHHNLVCGGHQKTPKSHFLS